MSEQESGQAEQSNEQAEANISASEGNSNHEETQHDSTSQQEDTSEKLRTNGSELGLERKESSEQVDSGEEFSSSLDTLVDLALNGELTDEARKSLDEQGLGKHFDMIVSGHKAEIAKNDAEIVGVVGGKEAYGELQEWALSNLDDSEIESFNKAVLKSGDIGLAKLAVEGLQARYAKANGQAPVKRIESGGTANEATRPYANRDEYINETMSMKYRQDPEYAALVEAKRTRSGF